jgi:hypothetical protein
MNAGLPGLVEKPALILKGLILGRLVKPNRFKARLSQQHPFV